jgi:hypothetical protein
MIACFYTGLFFHDFLRPKNSVAYSRLADNEQIFNINSLWTVACFRHHIRTDMLPNMKEPGRNETCSAPSRLASFTALQDIGSQAHVKPPGNSAGNALIAHSPDSAL